MKINLPKSIPTLKLRKVFFSLSFINPCNKQAKTNKQKKHLRVVQELCWQTPYSESELYPKIQLCEDGPRSLWQWGGGDGGDEVAGLRVHKTVLPHPPGCPPSVRTAGWGWRPRRCPGSSSGLSYVIRQWYSESERYEGDPPGGWRRQLEQEKGVPVAHYTALGQIYSNTESVLKAKRPKELVL